MNKTVNKEFTENFMKDYYRKLDEVTSKFIVACLNRNKIEIPNGVLNEENLKQISANLLKNDKKLMVVIVTNPDKNLVNGDTIVRKHIYCEIVKKGLKPGTFVNMIKRRFTAAQVKNSTWEVADYSKLLEEKKDDHN